MSVNKKIITALSSIANAYPGTYDSTGDSNPDVKYFVFNFNTIPADYKDNKPKVERYLLQIKYICPLGYNSLVDRKNVKKALNNAGFGWPPEIDLSDETSQIYLFECEDIEGIDYNG